MKRFISAAISAILIASTAAHTPTKADDNMIKIMCIGDSITDGYVPECLGSYRKFIYHGLTELGYSVDMVGSKESGGWVPEYTDADTGETFSFDNDYTGYSGYSIMSYSGRIGIYETLAETDCLRKTAPDIVTLQIGTNDMIDDHEMDKAPQRLEALVDYILGEIPEDSTLFLSTIPDAEPNRAEVYDWFGNYRHSPDWQVQYSDEDAERAVLGNIAAYNKAVEELAAKKQSEGRRVVLSHAPEAITDVKTQLLDGVHPNNAGYKAMGRAWTELIDDYLKNGVPAVPDDGNNKEDGYNTADLVKLSRWLVGYDEEINARYDVNGDGRMDAFDLVMMRKKCIENNK